LGVSFLTASSVSDKNGETFDYAVDELGFNLFVDAGIAPGWAVGLAWTPVKMIWSDSLERVGPTDGEISVTRSLGKAGAHRFAVKLGGVIPVGSPNPSEVPDSVYALFSQDVGGGELQPQWGWAGGGYWVQALAGLRMRSDGFAAQGRYGFAGGRSFGDLGMRFGLSGLLPLDTESNGRPSDQEQYYGFQLAADYRLNPDYKIGVQLDGMVGSGQELPLGGRGNLYLSKKW
jgi:hypothetical protein